MEPRHKVRWDQVPELGRFFTSEKARIAYRRLPNVEIQESDHGHTYPATVSSWIREDWNGKVHTFHSWSVGTPNDVWVE